MGTKEDLKLVFIGAGTFFTWANLLGYTENAWIMTSEFNKVVFRKTTKSASFNHSRSYRDGVMYLKKHIRPLQSSVSSAIFGIYVRDRGNCHRRGSHLL